MIPGPERLYHSTNYCRPAARDNRVPLTTYRDRPSAVAPRPRLLTDHFSPVATPSRAGTDLSRPADGSGMTGDERTADLEPELRSYGVSVESIDGGDPLELTYMTAFPGREIHRGEIGRALNALIDRAEADEWDPVRVEGTVVRSPGDVLGTWRAEGEWFEALMRYEISETEFSSRVLETLRHETEGRGDRDDGSEAADATETDAEADR